MPREFSSKLSRRQWLAGLPLAWTALSLAWSTADAGAPPAVPAPPWPVLDALRGRVVLVDFWASWCAPCRRSFPWMNDLQQRHGARGLVVIAVNVDRERSLADAFLRDLPAAFRVEFDAGGEVARQFQVQAMPTSFLIDRRGQQRARHAGFRAAQCAAREAQIQSLLEESSA